MAWFCLLKIVIDKFIARWGGFLAHLHSPWGYDEPEILRYSNRHFGPIGADAGHVCLPKGALLVNIGRDSTVDEMAAAEALQTEHLDGYAAALPTREARSEAL